MQGTNIKAVRLKRGMSQQELADAIGVTKSTISKYEKGQREPKYNVLRAIAAALGVDWTDLIPAEDEVGSSNLPSSSNINRLNRLI